MIEIGTRLVGPHVTFEVVALEARKGSNTDEWRTYVHVKEVATGNIYYYTLKEVDTLIGKHGFTVEYSYATDLQTTDR